MTTAASKALALVRQLKPSATTPKGALSQFLPAVIAGEERGASRQAVFNMLVKAGLVSGKVTFAQFSSAVSHAKARKKKREVVS